MAIEVLIIDDDTDFSTMIRILLWGQDFQIKSVLSGEVGIQTVENPDAAPDVVILDLLLPEVDGWEVCERIRSFSDVPNHILARELFEPEASSDKPAGSRGSMSSTDQICALADKAGVGMEFRTILQAALDVGLYARPYKKSIMYTPPSRRDRMVFTVWAEMKDDGVSIYAGPDTLLEFYPFDKAEVVENLGFTESGWHSLNSKQAERFSYGLRTLFKDLEINRDL